MKLLHYTNRNLFIFVSLLMGIWGVFFYFAIIDEIMDETDDTLENYREIIVSKVLDNPDLLVMEDNILHSYAIRPLTDEEAEDYEEYFYDSTIYVETEDEDKPVRVMKSCFRASDDKFYELELRISTLERDDMVEAIFRYLLILYVALLICVMIGMRLVLKKVFVPLHRLLAWLDKVIPGKPIPILDNQTHITEFKKLNEAAVAMSRRSEQAYEEQKQFIENASHELQTPLAISRGKLELLAESEGLTEQQLTDIDELYRTLGRAVKLNKSLLLLSRINNRQYLDVSSINLNEIVKEIVSDLMEVYEHKGIELSIEEYAVCVVQMNDSLAHILLTNLLKNAIVHNYKGGRLKVVLEKETLQVMNSGDKPLDKNKICHRFYRLDSDSKESTGLGLAIVKSITDMYGFHIAYNYDGAHSFVLNFVK